MEMQYDSKIIQEFAARLYRKANSVIATYTILGVIIGLGAGAAVGQGAGAIVGAAIVGVIGFVLGTERAFQYKLQAQTALCQVEIEKNTKSLNPQAQIVRESNTISAQSKTAESSPAAVAPAPVVVDRRQLGLCPNCESEIALTAVECSKCKAQFGPGAAWKVKPLAST